MTREARLNTVLRHSCAGSRVSFRSGSALALLARDKPPHSFSRIPAIALIWLRVYTGRPALIEVPVLNELFPAST